MNDEYDEGAEGEGSMAEGDEGEKRWHKYIGKLEQKYLESSIDMASKGGNVGLRETY